MGQKSSINSSKKSSNSPSVMGMMLQVVKHNPLRVLHVDDDLNQLMFTKIFLEDCDPDISVESISRPSDVVQALSVEQFDCVVSDYQMDEMDGIALTRRLRAESNVPIIIYTGRGSDEIEEVARTAGADGYVQKETDPIHYMGLCIQIRNVVHEKFKAIIKK
jgi:CheY-like chemotaxis protein